MSDSARQCLLQWRTQARQEAQVKGISVQEVDQLLEHYGWTRLHQALHQVPDSLDLGAINQCWRTRVDQRVPLQYLIGSVTWRHSQLEVNSSVLIPRPETELIIDIAIAWIQEHRSEHPGCWVDLGTGSGAIAIGLVQAVPTLTMIATDLSAAALTQAQANTQRLGLTHRIQFIQGSWFKPLPPSQLPVQGLISNPPYIPSAQLPMLQPEVAWHEPQLALDGGTTGLEAIHHLIQTAPLYVEPGGCWLVEVMQGQAQVVAQSLERQEQYSTIEVFKDLAGIERFVCATLRSS